MGLKVSRVSTKTGDCPILDDFVVRVKHVTQTEKSRLVDIVESAGDSTDVLSRAQMQAQQLADLYIVGWRGLTPAIIRSIGVDIDEDPAVIDGHVPYDAETAGQLWFETTPAKFSTLILKRSSGLLGEIERKKANLKNA